MNKYILLFFLFTVTLSFNSFTVLAQTKNPDNFSTQNWEEQENYTQGFARVMQHNLFSFIDKSGKLIHPVTFEAARNFSNQLAAVKQNGKWGFINTTGKTVIDFKYDIVYDFTETVTAVYANKKWQLINISGTVIKQLDVDAFYGFKNGNAKISKAGKWGTINQTGNIIYSNAVANAPLLNVPAKPTSNINPLSNSVSVCPDNIDFEFGSFQYWQCFLGQVDSVGNTNVITVTPSVPTPNRHTLYNRMLPSPLDPFGLFPTNPPDGSNFALKLGNTQIGAQAEKVRYPIHVPVNDSNFSIKYDYAVVFEDPGHTNWTQPRFQVTVIDSATNMPIQCATFEYISTSGLPGFAVSPVDPGVIYKPWSTVFLSLRGYAGRTMYLDFTNADCVRRGHWGYAYIDVEKPCGVAVEINYDCDSPHVTTLTGPQGFNIYNWWDSTFTTLLGSGQTLVLNPGPTQNSTIWLEMIPFNNYGCQDTLPVKITGVFTAQFTVSDTAAICAPHSLTFYNPYLPSTSTTWDFGDGTSGTGDTVTHVFNSPGSYLVRFNVVLPNGCIGSGYKLVTIMQPTGSFSFAGGYICNNQNVQFNAITYGADSLFWNFGDGTILHTTQDTIAHTYLAPGIYMPSLQMYSGNGCITTVPATDTVRIEMMDAGFTHTISKVCGSTSISVSDTSHSYFGIASRRWDFGDGTIINNGAASLNHTYSNAGNYTIRLITTGITGCADTASIPVTITINAMPVVAINGPAMVCQSVPVTLNSTVVSADAINYSQWTVSNGYSGSGASITTTFTTPGTYTFQLIVRTVHGCYDTTNHVLVVNPTPDVAAIPSQTLCSGSNTNAVNFAGSISGTIFNWTNTAPIIGLAASGSGNIASFTANSNGVSIVNAAISVTPTANGCPGIPKAFTITVNPTPNVMHTGNQALCNNSFTNAIQFTGAVSGASYNWTNTNSSIGLAVAGSGGIASFKAINKTQTTVTATIKVEPITAACQGLSQTFTITVNPTPDVEASQNSNVCRGSSIQLNATGAAKYTWSPALNLSCVNCANPSATPTDTIRYTVTGTSAAGCIATDSVLLNVIMPFDMTVSPGDTLCTGERINIQAYNASRYVWSPAAGLNRTNISNPTVSINTTTTYRVIGFDNNQCFTDTGYVTIVVGPKPSVSIGPDRSLSVGTPLTLNALTNGGPIVKWVWTPANELSCNNCPSPSTTIKNNAMYTVTVTNAFGCLAADTIQINSFCKSSQVYIPNAFTPDGDGLNDVLMIRGKGITVKTFRIFNRWGQLVFEKENFYPNDIKFGWDGKVRGVPATPDVYVYTAEVFCDNDIPYTYKGNVTILK